MSVTQIIGLSLLSVPFVAIFTLATAAMVSDIGWKGAATIYGFLGALFLGCYLFAG